MNILNYIFNKYTGLIIGSVVVCIGAKVLYDRGYNDGVAFTQGKIDSERAAWEAKISDIQASNDKAISDLTNNYKVKISELNNQIIRYKSNKTIITKYVTNDKITNGLSVLHDRLASQQDLSLPVDKPNEPSDNTYSDLANVLTINYNTCNQAITKLNTLQSIVKQYQQSQSEIINK